MSESSEHFQTPQAIDEITKAGENLHLAKELSEVAGAEELETAHSFVQEAADNLRGALNRYDELIEAGRKAEGDAGRELLRQTYRDYLTGLDQSQQILDAESDRVKQMLDRETAFDDSEASPETADMRSVLMERYEGNARLRNRANLLLSIMYRPDIDEDTLLQQIDKRIAIEEAPPQTRFRLEGTDQVWATGNRRTE